MTEGSAPRTKGYNDPLYPPTFVYRYYDASGRLLYVGVTGNLSSRYMNHKMYSHWFKSAARVTFQSFAQRQDAEIAELEAIGSESPEYNIQGIAFDKRKYAPRVALEPSVALAASGLISVPYVSRRSQEGVA